MAVADLLRAPRTVHYCQLPALVYPWSVRSVTDDLRASLAALLVALTWLVVSCTPPDPALITDVDTPAATGSLAKTVTASDAGPAEEPSPSATPIPTFTSSPSPNSSLTPTGRPTVTNTPTPTPTATTIGPCSQRNPDDELLTLVTLAFGLSRTYQPADLVPLAEYLPVTVTLGYPTLVRRVILDDLVRMVTDMQAAGLRPAILSGYRSYYAQSVAWERWRIAEPERASRLSAPPGHSEHQLGTAVDFGSPDLPALVGDAQVEFHTDFYLTGEGRWLNQHAQGYGFTQSYRPGSMEVTGLYYEPWHWRYVGRDLAVQLEELDLSLTAYLLQTQPEPCIP